MKQNNFFIAAVGIMSAIGIIGIAVYMMGDHKVEDVAAEQDDKADEAKKDDAEADAQFDKRGLGVGGNTNAKIPEQAEPNATPPRQDRRLGEQQQQPPMEKAAPQNDPRSLNEAVQQQLDLTYGDLFTELSLPEGKRQQVANQLSSSMKAEAQLGAKLMDPNVAVDDIMRAHDKIAQDRLGELSKILSPEQVDSVKQYQNDLPKRMQKKQLMGLVGRIGPERI